LPFAAWAPEYRGQQGLIMTAEDFRQVALGMPNATEGLHRRHPDFRVNNKVFATLGYPGAGWGMVKLTPEQQEMLVSAEPDIFKPATGAWGRRGSTLVLLEATDRSTALSALGMARDNVGAK